jgi:hypothetical protein
MGETARTLVENWLTAIGSGIPVAVCDTSTPEIALHGLGSPVRGRSSVSFVLTTMREVFPDLRLEPEILAENGTWVIVRFTARGTQQLPMFGLESGEVREVSGVACFSLSAQGITDIWLYVDPGQLGKLLVAAGPVGGVTGGEPSWLDRFTDSARDIFRTRLGALESGGERIKESAQAGGSAITEHARRIAATGQEYLRDATSGLRGRLDAPTREEFEQLRRTVDQLAARLGPEDAPSPGDTGHPAAT